MGILTVLYHIFHSKTDPIFEEHATSIYTYHLHMLRHPAYIYISLLVGSHRWKLSSNRIDIINNVKYILCRYLMYIFLFSISMEIQYFFRYVFQYPLSLRKARIYANSYVNVWYICMICATRIVGTFTCTYVKKKTFLFLCLNTYIENK